MDWIENLSWTIASKEIEAVTQKTTFSQDNKNPTYIVSLVNSTRHFKNEYKYFTNYSKKIEGKGTLSSSFCETIDQIPKPEKKKSHTDTDTHTDTTDTPYKYRQKKKLNKIPVNT